MKKLLLGSAAAFALTGGAAVAAEWSANVGGFFTGGVGFIDDDQTNDIGVIRDSEVIFNFRMTADNGISFRVKTELEAGDGSSAEIDENSMYVSGSFGTIMFGEDDGSVDGYLGSGNVGADFVRAADGTGLLFDFYSGIVDIASNGADTGDSIKINYTTPSFSGFEAGISYSPTLEDNGNATSRDFEVHAFEFGAQYSGEFSGVGITVGGGYVTDTRRGFDDDDSWAAGIKGSYQGFEAGFNYGWENDNAVTAGGTDDQSTIGVGLAYSTGPWKVGGDLGYVIDGPAEEDLGIGGGVSYALAPGVTAGATLEYADSDVNDDDAFAAGLWLALGF